MSLLLPVLVLKDFIPSSNITLTDTTVCRLLPPDESGGDGGGCLLKRFLHPTGATGAKCSVGFAHRALPRCTTDKTDVINHAKM